MSDQVWLAGFLGVLKEAVEGGTPGQGTAFLDGTKADGSGNNGLLATLAGLTAAQASDLTALGVSVAAHAAHSAFHMEVIVRWNAGERGPFDWKGSFAPGTVSESEWQALRARVRSAYDALMHLAQQPTDWDDAEKDAAGGVAGALAHVTYHLGAVRQLIKLV
ncbi:DinB family protein [Deinococcus sp.]|uniref:DinB family protein n=1 Tax=Deinococcus sp. TaxID=47478 RepID=UPI003CC66228